MSARWKTVLVVEDNEHDVFFLRRAFSKLPSPPPLTVVTDGRAAVEYLAGAGRGERALPGLVLLDLQLPYLTGFEVLKWLRQQTGPLGAVPAIILSSSNQSSDMEHAASLGADSYLVKTPDPQDLARMVAGLARYWEG